MNATLLPRRPPESIPFVIDGPLAAASFAWQLLPPQDARVVVVKCTLAIADGAAAEPLSDQDPPTGDLPHDDDEKASVRYPSDFAPFKPRADVMLVGHAYPQAPPAPLASVQLTFGKLHRAVAAVGDRTWEGSPTAPVAFARMPLRYERAFGGPGYEPNPLGVGVAGGHLPNLENPDRLIRSRGDRPAPACPAPVPSTFPARAGRLGRYDAAWLRERWPYFPRDFDAAYFNAAPTEQQIPYPRGDESFALSGVHPSLPVVRGRLPGISPRAFAAAATGALREIPLRLDTVWFDADALRVVLVWRGLLDVSAEHAPEVACLFACDAALGATLSIDEAAARLDRRVRAQYGPPPETRAEAPAAPAPAAPPPMARAEVAALLAAGGSLAGADLSRADLAGMDLSGRPLARTVLEGAKLDGAKLDGADLSDAVLARASAKGASFRGAKLSHANLIGASLSDADLGDATLADARLAEADARGARFRGARLPRASLADARLNGAVFDGAEAKEADFSGAALEGASFRGAVLDDAAFYGSTAAGCVFDDASMLKLRADGAGLAKATFLRVKAKEASLEDASLGGASFLDADLDGAVFTRADLQGAILTRASARGARFRHARLTRASALRANLMEASFEHADLRGADLRGANLHAVETRDAQLDGASLDQAIVTGSKLA